MKKLISLILALMMCLCCCSAGLAEAQTAATEEEAGMALFMAMMQMIPGMENVDW